MRQADRQDTSFCLYFKICSIKEQNSINVLPDFMAPGRVQITKVRANGVEVYDSLDPANLAEFQIPTDDATPNPADGTVELVSSSKRCPTKQRPLKRNATLDPEASMH